jgi:hypothetical protein
MDTKIQLKDPQVWEPDMMYATFELDKGTYLTDISISGIPDDVHIINLQLLCKRTKEDPTTYVIDDFHCRDQPEHPKSLLSYLVKWAKFTSGKYQFPGPWIVDMNFDKPCPAMPRLYVSELVKREPDESICVT